MGSDQLSYISSQTGEGGVITDSGTTLTNLPDDVYNSLILQVQPDGCETLNFKP